MKANAVSVYSDLELPKIARRINQREETIELLKQQTATKAFETLIEAKLQGQDLIQAKSRLPHGFYEDWLKANCPRSVRMASNYVRIATHWEKLSGLNQAESLRSAIALLAEDNSNVQPEETKRWPAYYEVITRASKLMAFVCKHSPKDWPTEGRDKLKEQLEPLAAELWPERFQA